MSSLLKEEQGVLDGAVSRGNTPDETTEKTRDYFVEAFVVITMILTSSEWNEKPLENFEEWTNLIQRMF